MRKIIKIVIGTTLAGLCWLSMRYSEFGIRIKIFLVLLLFYIGYSLLTIFISNDSNDSSENDGSSSCGGF